MAECQRCWAWSTDHIMVRGLEGERKVKRRAGKKYKDKGIHWGGGGGGGGEGRDGKEGGGGGGGGGEEGVKKREGGGRREGRRGKEGEDGRG